MQFLLLLSLVSATSYALAHENSHAVEKRLPATWFQERDHPVHKLFRRAALADVTFAEVGSDEWKSGFPTAAPDANSMPAAWASALDAAVKDGKIPKIPWTTQADGGDPTYPDGTDPNSPEVCSSTYQCRTADSVWDGPAGYFGISFDDGPLPFSDPLLDFLKKKGTKATHFMIGQNVLENPDQFKKTFEQGHDIAVHTYTHRAMTTLSNKDVVAELGWTMQIIHNSTGGFVPKFWRPPYGDSDTRVQAIAREIFGLKTVIWNKDTNDWGIAEGSQKKTTVQSSFTKFLKSDKKTGLVVLEHESSKQAVDMFIANFPNMKSNGWKLKSLAQLIGNNNAYQNVNGDDVKHVDMYLDHEGHDDAPAEEPPVDDEPTDDEPAPKEDDSDDAPAEDDGGDDEEDGNSGDIEVLPTAATTSNEPEETGEDSSSSSDDEDSSSSDDSEDSSSSDSEDSDSSSSSDDSDSSSSSDDDSSSSSDSEDPTSTSVDDSEVSDTADSKKDNGAATLLPRVAGMMTGSLLILLCIAPGVVMVLG